MKHFEAFAFNRLACRNEFKDTLGDTMYSEHVRFNPWIGKNYGTGSQWGVPLLILGESHYDREGLPENHNFTIELIEKYANGYKFEVWNPTFLTKILNTVVGSQGSPTLKDKRIFWDSVAFYSYIQEFVGDNYGQAPTEKMWNDAQVPFQEVIEKLEPACILVISKRLWIICFRQIANMKHFLQTINLHKQECTELPCLVEFITSHGRAFGLLTGIH